jgi:ADP-ribose pyrophosphatase
MGTLKPLGMSLGWRPRDLGVAYECQWFRVRQFELNKGEHAGTYTYVEHPGSVLVVPETADNAFLLMKTYRFTTDGWSWEIPAGTLADRGQQNIEEVAREELLEEVGGVCTQLEPLGTFDLTNGSAAHKAHIFIAHGVTLEAAPQRHAFEDIGEVKSFSHSAVRTLIARNEINDGDSALALLLALQARGLKG